MNTHVQVYAYMLGSMTLGYFRCGHEKMTPEARESPTCIENREAVGASEVTEVRDRKQGAWFSTFKV